MKERSETSIRHYEIVGCGISSRTHGHGTNEGMGPTRKATRRSWVMQYPKRPYSSGANRWAFCLAEILTWVNEHDRTHTRRLGGTCTVPNKDTSNFSFSLQIFLTCSEPFLCTRNKDIFKLFLMALIYNIIIFLNFKL